MKYIYITGILIIIGAILDVIFVSQRKRLSNRLGELLEKGQYKEIEKETETWATKFFVPVYNINFTKLTAAVRQDKYDEAKKLSDAFEKATMNKKERYSVFTVIFNYFVYKENREYSTMALEKLREVRDEENASYIDSLEQIYRIYIEKDDKDLESLLQQNSSVPDEYKYASDYLIAKIYENKKDKKNMNKYLQAGREHYAAFQMKFREAYMTKKD